MNPDRETDILEPRGNMMNMKDDDSKKNEGALSTGAHGGFFEIHVKGHLDDSWTDWLEGLEMKLLDNGEMILSGCIRDQAALMGILTKLYGLNLTLRSVNEVSPNKV
jgi:hypothetical protein